MYHGLRDTHDSGVTQKFDINVSENGRNEMKHNTQTHKTKELTK